MRRNRDGVHRRIDGGPGDEAGRAAIARTVISIRQIVIDGLWYADNIDFIVRSPPSLYQLMGRIRRVVAADIGHIANIVSPQNLYRAFQIAFLQLIAAGTERSRWRVQQLRPDMRRLSSQVDQILPQKAFNAITHAENALNAFRCQRRLNRAHQAGINDGSSPSWLPDHQIPMCYR